MVDWPQQRSADFLLLGVVQHSVDFLLLEEVALVLGSCCRGQGRVLLRRSLVQLGQLLPLFLERNPLVVHVFGYVLMDLCFVPVVDFPLVDFPLVVGLLFLLTALENEYPPFNDLYIAEEACVNLMNIQGRINR